LQEKKIEKNFLVENVLWLQSYFLENRFAKKNFDKFFGRKYFMVLKSFPQDEERKKCLAENFFLVAKSFPRKQVCMKRGR